MDLTQEQLEKLIKATPLTKDTQLFEGMHIYTISRANKQGVLVHKGLNLITHEIILLPNDRDWDLWESTPDSGNRSRYQVANKDDYWTIVDAYDLSNRSLMSSKEIKDMELNVPNQTTGFYVTYE